MKKNFSRANKAMALLLSIVMAASSLAGIPVSAASTPSSNLPVTAENERSMEFNEGWTFHLGDVSGAEKIDYDNTSWRKLNLPHDWSIEQDFTHDVSSEVGHLPGGIGWYRKSFVIPESMQGKRIRIEFGGVYMDSYVYVNGVEMGNYPYGYMPFSYDITDQVVCDGKTENVIAVKVTSITNPGAQTSRWYSGSGIYRDVFLTVTDPVHVAVYGSVVTTPNIEQEYEGGTVSVQAKTTVQNQGGDGAQVAVRNTILNYEDSSIFTEPVQSQPRTIEPGASAELTQTVQAQNPQLWSTESPNLYIMRTEILVDDQVVDTYDTRFGFRWFHFDNNEGFSLNGEYMKLQGVCMHHDQGALGAVANEAATARQMRIMKEMGSNAIRVTHNPASDVLLKQCDEQGLLVIDEAFDTWYYGKNANDYGRFFEKEATHPEAQPGITWGQYDLQQMIRRGINAPSIIMWSLGNEVYQSHEEKGVETVKKLVKWAKEIDTTRPTTMGEDKLRDHSANDSVGAPYVRIAQEVDVVGINYGEKNYDGYHEMYPDWIIYGSETSSALKSRGYYSDPEQTQGAQDVVEYQLSSYDNRAIGHGTTATNALIPDRDRKWIGGQFVWTGFDYIGEPSPYGFNQWSIPKSSYFGIVDTAGFAKDDYYLYQSQWLDVETDPMVHILPHWNWENESLRDKVTVDGKIPVRIYSNAPTVELFLNGVSLGEKSFAQKTTSDGRTYQQSPDSDRLYLEWPVPYEYQPGTQLVAVAKNAEGEEIARNQITTSGQAAKLHAYADRQVIQADGKDLAYITVDVTDASGNFMPTASNQLYFQVKGDAEIVGVDNGDPSSWERYKDTDGVWKRKAFSGKALVIVQSGKNSGSFTLTASGAGLDSSEVTVYTKGENIPDDEILGYETPHIIVNAGEQPTLPDTVTAFCADGSQKVLKAVWNTAEIPSQPAEVVLDGTAENGDPVQLQLTVRGLVGVKDTTVVTGIGEQPVLPEQVTAVWSDGLTERHPVHWQPIADSQLAQPGLIEVTGTVQDVPYEAIAKVHIKEATDDVNIALSKNGTVATATYEEGPDKHPVKEINDGDTGAGNGYGNWQQQNRTSDQVTLEFPQAYPIEHVTAWLTSMNTWQTPDKILIDYWNGEEFVPVSNQSKTTGFGSRTNPSQQYDGEQITFDPVTTSKLRFTFSVPYYNGGKDMMKITELNVWTKGVRAESTAALSSIELDGQPLEGFAPDTFLYTQELPFGADVPQVTAQAQAYASVFVRQALNASAAAQIQTVSEDGSTVQNYTVQFVQLPPVLETVTLTAESTQITEDDYIPLTVEGILQDGSKLDLDKAVVTYTVTDITGHAQIEHGQLVAYDEGEVSVTAHVRYLGKTVDSAGLTFRIAKNTKEKKLLSYRTDMVYTKLNQIPELPAVVTAQFEYGPDRELAVVWDAVTPQQVAQYGTVKIQGHVDGYELKPEITLRIRDAWVVQQVSAAVPRGMVPELPQTLDAYYTDQEKQQVAVAWQTLSESDFDLEPGSIVTVTGSAELDGTKLQAKASVRISEGIGSPNYVAQRNGYTLPIGLATYTNDNYISDTGYDRANYLNDGDKSFAMVAGKKVWSNWVSAPNQRTSDWISAVIAYEGKRAERYVDRVSVGFCSETEAWQQIRVPENYYVEYYTGPLDYELPDSNGQVESWEGNPLNDSSNWKEVEYISKPAPSDLDGSSMTDITFKPIKTNLVRVRMDAQPGRCLGVNELEVYGQQALTNGDFSVNNITLDGENVLDQFSGQGQSFTLEVQADSLPEIAADVSDNAQVTIIPAAGYPGVARILIVPENGDELKRQVYTIRFQPKLEPNVPEIVYEDGVLKGIPSRTTVEALKGMLKNLGSAQLQAVDQNGEPITDDRFIGTDSTVQVVVNGAVIIEAKALVMGDVNGDGNVNVMDLLTIKSMILGRIDVSDLANEAADMTKDGLINIFDLVTLKMQILKS